ncbi:MAG TPA: tetratricopeptide repeat protein [Ferruginibacter sp.]|jgi:tetratricopeptide (TPR) repeat protein|nr:tetratricopeptide repeat protein [Ferruginibacter sp.]
MCKKIFIVLIVFIAACNNQPKENPAAETESVSEEQKLKNAVQQFPDSMLLKETLVQYYREHGNYDQALLEVNRAIETDSVNPRFWDMKAILHFEDGDTLQSIKSFESAIHVFPNPEYMISLGTLYAQTKNKKALSISDTLLRYYKNDAEKEALFIKGLYYTYINEKMRSIDYFNKCISISFTFMDAYREKAIALYDMGKYPEALNVLDKAITLQNRFEEGYYYRGMCLEKLKQVPEAVESYQLALQYDPEYTEARDALARLGFK